MNARTERGQILIIGAVAMVVLIGIAGLVVDLGFSWMMRRSQQNAVDPATIAAARFIPGGSRDDMAAAACFYARENGFFPDATVNSITSANGCVPANDPQDSLLEVNWPSTNPEFQGSGYVEVVLSGSRDTFFSKIFGFQTMNVTTGAVAANGTGGESTGQLVSLDPTSCGAGKIRGNGTVDVGGSIYVNSDGSGPPPCIGAFDDACSGTNGAFRFEGINARLIAPQVSVRGTCGRNANPFPSNCSTTCDLTEGASPITDPLAGVLAPVPLGQMPAPSGSVSMANCDGPTDNGCSFGGAPGSVYTANPGVYYGGWTITRELRVNPGIYYIAGGGIQVSGGGRIVANGVTPGDGDGRILIYSTDGPQCASLGGRKCQGPLLIEGQGGFQARAYEQNPAIAWDDDYHRIVIWQAQWECSAFPDGCLSTSRTYPGDTDFDNDKVRIAGMGLLDFWGTIYAPKSLVELEGQGSGDGTAGVHVLAWRFDIGGIADLDMPFDPDELHGSAVKGLVH